MLFGGARPRELVSPLYCHWDLLSAQKIKLHTTQFSIPVLRKKNPLGLFSLSCLNLG